MVATHLTTQGGVSAVVRGYRDAGLFDRLPLRFVHTHRDGGAIAKATTAITGLARVAAALLRMDAPLVHIHMSHRASFWRKSIVCLLARMAGRPYILHVHGSEFMRFYDDECGPRAKQYVRRTFGHAAVVLALSDEWRHDLARIVPRERIEVLRNGVALPPPAHAAASAASGDGATADGVSSHDDVLFLGRLGARKGSFELLRAFASVAPRFPRARLVLAGDGEVDATRQLADELGLGARIRCPGWLSTEQVRDALQGCTIFALPSHAEGLPMALLEAMAAAKPPLVTPVGGIPGLVRDGVNGLLVPPGDEAAIAAALERLLGDAGLRERLGAAARESIRRDYSIDASIARLEELYSRFGIVPRSPLGNTMTSSST
jgi:glycosyltransferase involved in cell wall biosynthesis